MKAAAAPTDPAHSPPAGRSALAGLTRADWEMVAWVMGVKVLILSFGVQAVASYVPSHPNWLQIWDNWDASHYLRLAENGYVAAGDARVSLVFFPLYPWLVRLVAFVVQNYIAAALIVSGFASAATAVLLRRLACCDETEQVARNAVWFLLIFPTSFFLHVPYTESLFLALCLGCFLAARKSHWALAGVLGACACLTRVNGLMLGPALAAEVALQFWQTRRINFRWLWLALVPVGFLGYLWLNHEVTGDFFAFTKIMHEHWYKKFASPWFGIHDVYLRALGMNINEGLNEFIGIILVPSAWFGPGFLSGHPIPSGLR